MEKHGTHPTWESFGGKIEMNEFVPTPWPTLPLPSRAQATEWGIERTMQYLNEREELIRLEQDDPYNYGFYLQCWKDTDQLLTASELVALFGGNGAGKTFYMARRGIQTLLENPGEKVLWLHESEKTSIFVHQSAVWHYLPKEFKNQPTSRKIRIANITYSAKSGFAENRFVLPNGSMGVFGAYKQDLADYEGTGWKLICADENMPLAWLKTLRLRLPRRNGKFLWGYTPINGMTPAIHNIAQGAKTLESRPVDVRLLEQEKVHVPDCPSGHMPYIRDSLMEGTKIIYFFSSMNPYGGYEKQVGILKNMSTIERERRGYGFARNTVRALFPQFGKVHIVEPDKVPTERVTRRMATDPAPARNMFTLWVSTDEFNRRFIYREWPDVPRFGEWAVTSEDANKWDGAVGPAQESQGYGISDYKRIFLEEEGNHWEDAGKLWNLDGEKIYSRGIDPRSGSAQTVTENQGGTSIIDMMMEDQTNDAGDIIGPALYFEPAPGLHEDQGIMAINSLLSFNSDTQITPILNEPKLFISSACQNLIWALQNYTKHDGEKAACKDPIDVLRYIATGDSEFVSEENLAIRGGGGIY